MPRFFTLRQAEEVLPEMESLIREAVRLKSRYEDAENELHATSRRIMVMGGITVDCERLIAVKTTKEESATRLKDAVEIVNAHGCLIKDLDSGLLDFPTLYRGEEVYLCWKLGERGIGFWHGVSEGFAGRKKIDREFLDHHQGDRSN